MPDFSWVADPDAFLGDALLHKRRDRLPTSLRPEATTGMVWVLMVQSYYAAGGFVFSHRNPRLRCEVPAAGDDREGFVAGWPCSPTRALRAFRRRPCAGASACA